MVALIADSKWDMDESGKENGRHKPDQYKPVLNQWMPPQQQMKDHPAIKLMAALAERDAAIQERNAAFSEKKAALAERDLAILQRDAAIQERNAAAMERDNAMAALEYARENAMNGGSACPPGCPAPRGSKHVHHPIQPHHQMEMPFHARETQTSEPFPISVVEPAAFANAKLRRAKRPRKDTKVITYKKAAKPQRKGRRTASSEDTTNKHVAVGRHDTGGPAEDLNKQLSVTKHEWKGQDLGLNQVMFDDSTMPIPVCSCTGVLQQCYKWGNGGWQSACCTTTMSMYPLPVMANKRHARVGGRKMSGSAFSKLLSRLAAEGHDLSNPLDLKDHWAKHGTNRYITIK